MIAILPTAWLRAIVDAMPWWMPGWSEIHGEIWRRERLEEMTREAREDAVW